MVSLTEILVEVDCTHALKLSSPGSLRLDYLVTDAIIHQRILTASSQGILDPRLWDILTLAASARLFSVIDFVQEVKPQELTSFWYAATKTNLALIATFGIILCATAKSPGHRGHRDFFVERLKAYRWALKINYVAGAQFMKPALSLLEANIKILVSSTPQYDGAP